MAASDINPVVARIVNRILTVPNIGVVAGNDLFDRDDLGRLVVSNIAGVDRLRAWWVSGPTMTGTRTTQSSGGHLLRSWSYQIYGVEGLVAADNPQQIMRANALAVTDAIDLDRDLGGTCHKTDPCSWQTFENRAAWRGIAAVYVQIRKTVHTLSTP